MIAGFENHMGMDTDDLEGIRSGSHFYKFELTKPGRLNLKIKSNSGVSLEMLDSTGKEQDWWFADSLVNMYWRPNNSDASVKDGEFYIDLVPHMYYLAIHGSQSESDYTIQMDFKPTTAKNGEKLIIDPVIPGNRDEEIKAYPIDLNQKYVSMFPYYKGTTTEYFKFTLDNPSPLFLSINSAELNNVTFGISYGGTQSYDYISFEDLSTTIYKGKGYTGKQLVTHDVPWHTPRLHTTKVFPSGTYFLKTSENGGVFDTGCYSFEISTKSKAGVKSVTLNKKQIALGIGGTETLTATIKPDNADDKGIIWTVENENFATVDANGTVKGIRDGYTTVRATSVNGPYAECVVRVLNVPVDGVPKEDCPLNAVKEKVDLTTSQYFDKKYDKYEVTNSKVGSVDNKGFFTSKASGTTQVRGLVKAPNSNLYVCAKTCVINVEQPEVKYEKDGKKEIKFFTAKYEGEVFDAAAVVDSKGVEITGWQISDKKGNFELLDGGKIQCNKNGTNTKITPLFGADKTPGNITFTLKTVTPKLSATKKLKQQTGQSFVLKLSNCTKSSEIEWKFEADPTDTRVAVQTDAVTITEVNTAKPSKLQRKININKAVSGKIVATVDGHDYECAIEVVSPEIKKSPLVLKAGKAGAVGVKNTKIKDITWTTSDSSKVEIVDAAKGKIKAVAPGTATISVEIGGVTVSCEVTVTE